MSLDSLDRAMKGSIDLSVGDIISKYGNKEAIALAAQKGEIPDMTKAVMAGMAIDRITASAMKPPTTTVAQDTFAQPQINVAAAQQPQPQRQGLDQIPVSDQMFEPQGMAGGGIVAFYDGGTNKLDPRVAALMQRNPGMTVAQAARILATRVGPMATFGAGLAATDALMATDTGAGRVTPGYDYGTEQMAGGMPEVQAGTTGQRGQSPGFMDYLRAVGLAPKEQVMDPVTGKYVDAPAKPLFQSATPGLAGTYDEDANKAAIEKRLAAAEAGKGPDVERNSLQPELADAARKALGGGKKDETGAKKGPAAGPVTPKPTAEAEPKPKSYADYLSEVKAAMGERKVGDDMRNEIKADREARKEAQQQAGWMRLVEAGLGIMGGESPYALANIGKGATAALKGYAEDLREQKKLDREDRKILLELDNADRAEKRDNYKLATDLREKALDRMSTEKRTQISADATRYAANVSAQATERAYSQMKPGAVLGEERQRLTAANEQISTLLYTPDYRKASAADKKAMQDNIYRQFGIDPNTKRLMGGQGGLNVNTSALGPVIDFQTALGAK